MRPAFILTERAAKTALARHHDAVATGRRIRWAREVANVSRLELAVFIGSSPRTVRRVEAGERALRPAERAAVARALGTSLALLTVAASGHR
jgi:transcriptional regulator with XRE-family HTH domain